MTDNEQAVIDAAVHWLDIESARENGVPVDDKGPLQALRDALYELHNEHDGRYSHD